MMSWQNRYGELVFRDWHHGLVVKQARGEAIKAPRSGDGCRKDIVTWASMSYLSSSALSLAATRPFTARTSSRPMLCRATRRNGRSRQGSAWTYVASLLGGKKGVSDEAEGYTEDFAFDSRRC